MRTVLLVGPPLLSLWNNYEVLGYSNVKFSVVEFGKSKLKTLLLDKIVWRGGLR